MKEYFKALPRVTFARNKSWRESAKLGLFNGVVWAPLTLWEAVKSPLLGIGAGLFGLVAALVIFAYVRVVVLIAGLAGYLTHTGWGHRNASAE